MTLEHGQELIAETVAVELLIGPADGAGLGDGGLE